MQHHAEWWTTAFVFVGFVSLAGGGILWGRRSDVRGGAILSLHLGALGLWTSAYGLSLGVPVPEAIEIRNVAQVCIIVMPLTGLLFSERFTHRDGTIGHGLRRLLVLITISFALIALTNVGGAFLPNGRSPVDGTITQPGPAYLLALGVASVELAFSSWWMLRYALTSQAGSRATAVALVMGTLSTWVGSYLTAIRFYPFGVDATTLSLTVMSASVLFAVFNDGTAQLRRLWTRAFVQGYGNGFLVLDNDGRIVHGNDAVLDLLDTTVEDILQRPASAVLFRQQPVVQALRSGRRGTVGPLPIGDDSRLVLFDVLPLEDGGRRRGTVLQIRDVTHGFTDALTGVGNRRHFYENGNRVLTAGRERQMPCAIGLIDLDHLKALNDESGHAAGDAALTATAQALTRHLGHDAVVSRLGGDEFAVAVAGLTAEECAHRLEAVQAQLAPLGCHISAGTTDALGDESLVALLGRADGALLEAKRRGRNLVLVHRPELREVTP